VKEHRQLQAYLDFHCLSLRLGLACLSLDFWLTFMKVDWNGRHLRAYVKRVFGSVVVVAFQIVFRAEIHVNDVFLFFKNHF